MGRMNRPGQEPLWGAWRSLSQQQPEQVWLIIFRQKLFCFVDSAKRDRVGDGEKLS